MLFDLLHLEDGALGRFGTSTHMTLGLHGKFGRGLGVVLVKRKVLDASGTVE